VGKSTVNDTLFLHLPFHPDDPKSSTIQKTFNTTMLQPTQEPHLSTIRNRHSALFKKTRLTVAYHRQRSLKELLIPRRLRQLGVCVSVIQQNILSTQRGPVDNPYLRVRSTQRQNQDHSYFTRWTSTYRSTGRMSNLEITRRIQRTANPYLRRTRDSTRPCRSSRD